MGFKMRDMLGMIHISIVIIAICRMLNIGRTSEVFFLYQTIVLNYFNKKLLILFISEYKEVQLF